MLSAQVWIWLGVKEQNGWQLRWAVLAGKSTLAAAWILSASQEHWLFPVVGCARKYRRNLWKAKPIFQFSCTKLALKSFVNLHSFRLRTDIGWRHYPWPRHACWFHHHLDHNMLVDFIITLTMTWLLTSSSPWPWHGCRFHHYLDHDMIVDTSSSPWQWHACLLHHHLDHDMNVDFTFTLTKTWLLTLHHHLDHDILVDFIITLTMTCLLNSPSPWPWHACWLHHHRDHDMFVDFTITLTMTWLLTWLVK